MEYNQHAYCKLYALKLDIDVAKKDQEIDIAVRKNNVDEQQQIGSTKVRSSGRCSFILCFRIFHSHLHGQIVKTLIILRL